MNQAAWKKVLQTAIASGGGILDNGWTVKVHERPTGGRDVSIKGTGGERFRSIVQAVAALTCEASAQKPKSMSMTSNQNKETAPEVTDEHQGGQKRKKQQTSDHRGSQRPVKRRKPALVDLTADATAGKQRGQCQAEEEPPKEHPIFGKLISKAKTHISRIRREQDIIEVYKAEGWRGSNKDKLKPRAEMQRAEQQIEKSKTILREILQQCEEAEGKAIPADLFDEDGELDEEHIFCAICSIPHSSDDNDIVLCDGPCNRAYHEQCCVPPFRAEGLSEEADWLCPACTAKDDILDIINEEFETNYELDTPASSVLQESEATVLRRQSSKGGAAAIGGATWAALLGGDDLVSSDTDDDSYRGQGEDAAGVGRGTKADAKSIGGSLEDGDGVSCDTSSDSDSGSSSDEESEDEIVEGKRERKAVDYQALNAEMFGDDNDQEEELSEGEWE